MKLKLPLAAFFLLTNLMFAQHPTHDHNKYERTIFQLKDLNQKKDKPFNRQIGAAELKKLGIPATDWNEILDKAAYQHNSQIPRSENGNNSNGSNQKPPAPSPTPYNANCPNLGFEQGNFNNWTGGTWTLTGTNWTTPPVWTPGIVSNGNNASINDPNGRHTLTTIPPGNNDPALGPIIGWDSLSINPTTGLAEIPLVCPWGSGISCRLGNSQSGSQTERLVYPMSVTAQNAQVTYQYAIVLNDPGTGHGPTEQPEFKITVYDAAGNVLGGQCGYYSVNVQQAAQDPTFIYNPSVTMPGTTWTTQVYYKNWTSVGLDLSPWIGQNVFIEFRASDCSMGGHFGYCYFDVWCGGNQIPVNFCGATTAVLTAPTGYVSYQWAGPNTSGNIPGATNDSLVIANAVIGNTYTVTCTAANGCNTQFVATIVPSTIGFQSFNITPSCANGSSGSATAVASGSSSGNYNFSWVDMSTGNVVSTSATATGLAPGQYSVTVSDPACGSEDSIISVGISPPLFYTDVQNFCSSPAPVIAPSGSNYVWYDASGNLISGATTATLSVVNPTNGSYYTTVFDNPTGCRDSVKITLSQTVNTTTVNATFCGTSATQCAPTGATNVIWYDANWPYSQIGTGSCITINNPVTTTWSPYSYSYTNPTTGCKDSVRLYLTNIPASINVASMSPSCVNDSTGSVTLNISSGSSTTFTLTVTGPVPYSNNSAGATTTIPNLPAGSYTATFSDAQCTSSTSFTINPNPVNVTVTVAPTTICTGQQATVNFNYGGGTPTSCQVAATGCAGTTLQTVGTGTTQNSSTNWPTPYGNWYANEKYQILYSAADLLAAGVTAGKITSIGWDVVSIPSGMNTTFIDYQIKIGCTSASDLDPNNMGWGSIPFLTPPMTTVWGPQTHVVTTGWSNHMFSNAYEWDGASNILVEICYTWSSQGNFTNNAIVNSTATTYRSFLVFNSDMTPACSQTMANQSMSQRPNTRFNTCQSVSLPSDFTYNWSPATGVSGTPPTVDLAPATSTNYTLTVTSNNGGCTIDTVIPITIVNPFTITMPAPQTYCFVDPVDTLTAVTNPSTPGVWTLSGGATGMTDAGNGSDGYFDPSVAGLGTYYAVFTAGGTGCAVTDSVQIIVNTVADASISAAGPFCVTDAPITLNVLQPGGTFYGGGITNPTTGAFSPSVAGAGTDTVSYVINGACSDSTSIYIVIYPQPIISIASDTTEGCNPTNISFTSTVPAPANGNAQWFFGDGFTGNSQNMIHQYLDTGLYSVTFIYTDANGCSDTVTNSNMVWIHPSVTAAFTATPNQTTIIDGTVAFTNQSIGSNTYLWQLTEDTTSTDVNPVFVYTDPGTYNVVLWASNEFGCMDTVSNTVIIEPAVALYVPNAFTPGDENNLNDVFQPYISGIDMTTYRLEIYDRWGERIFQTEDVAEGWNGKRNNSGQLVQNGVYIYKIYYKDTDKKKVTYVGHVTVVK